MIEIDPEKRALLEAAERLCMADLITITTRTGAVLRHTSADVDLYIEGQYFDSSLRWERERLSIKAGLEMSTMQLTIFPQETDMIGGLKLSQAVRAGVLDGADFLLERAFFIPDWNSYQFKITRFGGRFADIEDFSRSEIPITVNSSLEILNVSMPREVYQPGCRRVLYGDGCDMDRSLFSTDGTVTEGTTAQVINLELEGPERPFTLGIITGTSGENAGIARTIKNYADGTFTVVEPFPAVPAVGDTFTAWAGCDRQFTTCRDIFGNESRFSGEPFVPAAETAY